MVQVTVGTPPRVDELLERYPGLHAGVFANETDALLASLLIEQRADRTGTDPTVGQDSQEPADVGGQYAEITDQIDASDGWTQYQPGFVSTEVDIRHDEDPLNEDILVAFTRNTPVEEPGLGEPGDVVYYHPSEFPVTGVPVETGNIWVRLREGASQTVTFHLEVWG